MAGQTVIIIPNSKSERAGVSTNVGKWIRRMELLTEGGVAEEVQSEVEGNREWEVDGKLIRLPFQRKVRVWTKKQRKDAQDRLAAVRAANAAKREAENASKKKVTKTSVKEAVAAKVPAKKITAVAAPVKAGKKSKPIEDEDEDFDDEDLEDDDDDLLDDEDEDEEEEVVVKSKKSKK